MNLHVTYYNINNISLQQTKPTADYTIKICCEISRDPFKNVAALLEYPYGPRGFMAYRFVPTDVKD